MFIAETGKEASLNLGVGYGLIYLLKHELNKMVELRRRIESLLQHFQTEIDNQDEKRLRMPSRSSICSSITNIHVQEILHTQGHDSGESSSPNYVKQPETGYHCIRYQLEAELEAELCRLQLPEDGEFVYSEVQSDHFSPPNTTFIKAIFFLDAELLNCNGTGEGGAKCS